MENKNKKYKKMLSELERAIKDIKKMYGNSIDTNFLKEKINEILKNNK